MVNTLDLNYWAIDVLFGLLIDYDKIYIAFFNIFHGLNWNIYKILDHIVSLVVFPYFYLWNYLKNGVNRWFWSIIYIYD